MQTYNNIQPEKLYTWPWCRTRWKQVNFTDSAQTRKTLKFAYLGLLFAQSSAGFREVFLFWVCHLIWKFNDTHETAAIILIHCISLAAGEAKEGSKKNCGRGTFLCQEIFLCSSHDNLLAGLHSWASNITLSETSFEIWPLYSIFARNSLVRRLGPQLTVVSKEKKLEENAFHEFSPTGKSSHANYRCSDPAEVVQILGCCKRRAWKEYKREQ